METPVLNSDRNDNNRSDMVSPKKDEFMSNYCQVMKFTDTRGNTKEMYFPKSLDLERPKRSRTNFTLRQLKELEKSFAKNQYLVGKERKSLSKQLDLSEAQIKIWYQNRRTKHKKEQFRQRESQAANAESIAATNIMHLLQKQSHPGHLLDPHHHHHRSATDKLLSSLSSPDSTNTSTITAFNAMTANSNHTLKANGNPFFYSNSHWNDTNYLSPLYFASHAFTTNSTAVSPLHK